MHAAFAAPPIGHRATIHLDSRPALDLRTPTLAMGTAENSSRSFPSFTHRQAWDAEEKMQPAGLASAIPQSRIPGGAEEFARRVHREGLPVARLWENKSALVSLGLNQKGKLGLWLIQKVH